MSTLRKHVFDTLGRTARTFTSTRRKRYAWPNTVLRVVMESQHLVPGESWESAHERGAIKWRAELVDGTRIRSHSMRDLARKCGATRVVPLPRSGEETAPAPAPAPVTVAAVGVAEIEALKALAAELGMTPLAVYTELRK